MQTTTLNGMLNGIDRHFMEKTVEAIDQEPSLGATKWNVVTEWKGGELSETRITEYMIGGQRIAKDFTLEVDEPLELGGTNRHANPQEFLMTAMNSCMMIVFVTQCAMQGIELESLRIETEGDIDLRGMLQLADVPAGYETLKYRFVVKGTGTPEQFEAVHAHVRAAPPNYFNMATAIAMNGSVVVE